MGEDLAAQGREAVLGFSAEEVERIGVTLICAYFRRQNTPEVTRELSANGDDITYWVEQDRERGVSLDVIAHDFGRAYIESKVDVGEDPSIILKSKTGTTE